MGTRHAIAVPRVRALLLVLSDRKVYSVYIGRTAERSGGLLASRLKSVTAITPSSLLLSHPKRGFRTVV